MKPYFVRFLGLALLAIPTFAFLSVLGLCSALKRHREEAALKAGAAIKVSLWEAVGGVFEMLYSTWISGIIVTVSLVLLAAVTLLGIFLMIKDFDQDHQTHPSSSDDGRDS